MIKETRTTIPLHFTTKEQVRAIDKAAKKAGMQRSTWLRMVALVASGAELAKQVERLR